MTKKQAIAKYNLQRETKNCLGDALTYERYSKTIWDNNTETIYTVEQDELAKEYGEELYFLIVEKIYHNQVYVNKYGLTVPKTKTTIIELTA